MLRNDVNRFIKVCLDSAVVANNSELDDIFLRTIGLGKFAYSRIMRNGVKGIIEMQIQNTDLQSQNEMLKSDIEIYKKIACSYDLEYLNDDVLKQIKDFIDEIVKKEIANG